ncbi:MAG: response regulator [Chitinispirillaceae bacterium]|nr:response regulator [Chitinispirillaceae bacterium]
MRRVTHYSEDALKAKLIHEDAERYKFALISAFAGITILTPVVWLLLQSPSLNLTIPVEPLKYLTGTAFFACLGILLLSLYPKKLQLSINVLSILFSLMFFPTLMFTGGFMSPFIIVYMLTMLLSIIMVDIVPIRIGVINFFIITSSYVFVSLAQKTGIIPVHIDFVERLMMQDYFFWLVFISVCICFINGFIAVYATSRNIKDTLTQMILTYRHVAEGTSALIGEQFETEICEAVKRTLQTDAAFLIKFDSQNGDAAQIIYVNDRSCEHYEKKIGNEFRNFLIRQECSEHVYQVGTINGFPLDITPATQFVYWIRVDDSVGTLSAILGITDPLVKKIRGILAADILQIFANRLSAELARSREEKKRLQMQLLLGQGQKMQAIGKLANVIAHDFNNILNGIFGFASLIARVAGPDSIQAKYTGRIFQLGNNATTLISQLLSYSGTRQVNSEPVDISSVVEECLEIIRLTIKKKITITDDFKSGCFVNGDVSMVQSALLNLMLNACDSMADQGILTVKIGKHLIGEAHIHDFLSGQQIPSGEYTTVLVMDTGCGIPEDHLTRIFEPFFTTKGAGRGTGLGLAAVVGCMEAHSGYITVRSVPGGGSMFKLFFPVNFNQQEPDIEDVKGPDSFVTSTSSFDVQLQEDSNIPLSVISNQYEGQKYEFTDTQKIKLRSSIRKILVVDDEVMFLDALTMFLSGLNYNIISSSSGESAVGLFNENKDEIEITILDMMIPDIAGRVLMDRFRVTKPEIEVIIMTGYSNSTDLEYVKKQGVLTILNKPFEFALLDTILLNIAFKRCKNGIL